MENINSRGSEACHHNTGGFGPCWWVAQLLLLLEKQKQIAKHDKQSHIMAQEINVFLHKPIITAMS